MILSMEDVVSLVRDHGEDVDCIRGDVMEYRPTGTEQERLVCDALRHLASAVMALRRAASSLEQVVGGTRSGTEETEAPSLDVAARADQEEEGESKT